MPIVPKFESRGVQEQSTNTGQLSTQVPRGASGAEGIAQTTQAAQGLSRDMANFIQEEKGKADKLKVQEAYNNMVEKTNDLIYNPMEGVLTKRGADSFTSLKDFGEKFDSHSQFLRDKVLTNEDQRTMFNELAGRKRSAFDSQIQKHTFRESQKYDEEVTETTLRSQTEDAVLNYHEPGAVGAAIETQKETIAEHGKRLGKPTEWVKQKQIDVVSGTHSKVVERMLSNDQDVLAEEYFKQTKDELNANDTVALEKAIEAGSLRLKSQRAVDDLMGENLTVTEARDRVREEYKDDPKLRDEVDRRLRAEYGAKKAAEQEDKRVFFENVATRVEKTMARPSDSEWSTLTLAQRNNIDARIRQLRSGSEPGTDWGAYYELKQIANQPELKEKFLRKNLYVDYRHKLGDAEFKEMVKAQAALRKGEAKIDYGFRTKTQIVNDTLEKVGIEKGKSGSSEAKRRALFTRSLEEQVILFEEQTGKKATREDLQSIADELVIKGEVPWFIWNSSKFRFEVSPGEDFIPTVDTVDDIPKHVQKQIINKLKEANLPIDNELIVEYYERDLNRRGGS